MAPLRNYCELPGLTNDIEMPYRDTYYLASETCSFSSYLDCIMLEMPFQTSRNVNTNIFLEQQFAATTKYSSKMTETGSEVSIIKGKGIFVST